MSTHTPGPWHITADFTDEQQSIDYLRIESKDAAIAREILVEADARLIATVPDLLAAAQYALTVIAEVRAGGTIESETRLKIAQQRLFNVVKAADPAYFGIRQGE